MTHIIYHPRYNIGFLGIERLHPFDSHKYGRAWKLLKAQFGDRLTRHWIQPDRPVQRQELLVVHSATYLNQLRKSLYVAMALELPLLAFVPARLLDSRVLLPMRWATRGTILAARTAISAGGWGFAVNLSGGYHHAKPENGEGFCIYSDIGLAIHDLRARGQLSENDTVAYIDLDAHQGNGVCYVFKGDPRVFIFDVYNGYIYPGRDPIAQSRIDHNLPVSSAFQEADYLSLLERELPSFMDSSTSPNEVRLAIYNAGTDVYQRDALGGLNLSEQGILRRDTFVINEMKRRQIPTVMLLSGGYSRESYRLVANTVRYCLEHI